MPTPARAMSEFSIVDSSLSSEADFDDGLHSVSEAHSSIAEDAYSSIDLASDKASDNGSAAALIPAERQENEAAIQHRSPGLGNKLDVENGVNGTMIPDLGAHHVDDLLTDPTTEGSFVTSDQHPRFVETATDSSMTEGDRAAWEVVNKEAGGDIKAYQQIVIDQINNGPRGVILPAWTSIPEEGEVIGDQIPGYESMSVMAKVASWWTKKQRGIFNAVVFQEVRWPRMPVYFDVANIETTRSRLSTHRLQPTTKTKVFPKSDFDDCKTWIAGDNRHLANHFRCSQQLSSLDIGRLLLTNVSTFGGVEGG